MSKLRKKQRLERRARREALQKQIATMQKKIRQTFSMLDPTPYKGRNTKANFKELLDIIGYYDLLLDEKRQIIKKLESDNMQLLDLCNDAAEAMKFLRKRIDQEDQVNAFLKDIVLEFGDHFDYNDFMFQSTHLKMHLNANHRVN